MDRQYQAFEQYLCEHAHILDAGCGSGRDSLYFKNRSYRITAFDASEKMSAFASELLGEKVAVLSFEELDFNNLFDAVWASASLLHIPKKDMPAILQKLAAALKDQGVLYASFKYGEHEFIKENRLFNSYTEKSFTEVINNTPFQTREIFVLEDSRPEKKGEFWLNAILTVDKG